jgi:3-oxoacyl-[acyl-carrier-protein] synthase II
MGGRCITLLDFLDSFQVFSRIFSRWNMNRRVVVTGVGVLSPIGSGVDEFWTNLCAGVSGAAAITHFDTEKFSSKFACELKDFDASQYLRKIEAKRMDPFCQYGVVASQMALENSGIDLDKTDLYRAGVIMASGIGGMTAMELAHTKLLNSGPGRIPPMFIPMMISDILPGQVSMRWGFKGPNFSTVSACASSSHAIGCAIQSIRSGQADVMLTGGSEASITPLGIGGFNALQALSTRNDEPQKASRPFDRDRDGFVMGEGSVVLVVEELQHALKRGANILAELAGLGFTADAYHLTAPAPEGEGAQRAMKMAIEDAGMQLADIGHINTHGTSTPAGDPAEIQGIAKVFGQLAPDIAINSTKSMTGHLLGAAGAIECLATALAVKHGIVPATINLENQDPEIELPIVSEQSLKVELSAAISNTFGFGGHNASLVVKKYE